MQGWERSPRIWQESLWANLTIRYTADRRITTIWIWEMYCPRNRTERLRLRLLIPVLILIIRSLRELFRSVRIMRLPIRWRRITEWMWCRTVWDMVRSVPEWSRLPIITTKVLLVSIITLSLLWSNARQIRIRRLSVLQILILVLPMRLSRMWMSSVCRSVAADHPIRMPSIVSLLLTVILRWLHLQVTIQQQRHPGRQPIRTLSVLVHWKRMRGRFPGIPILATIQILWHRGACWRHRMVADIRWFTEPRLLLLWLPVLWQDFMRHIPMLHIRWWKSFLRHPPRISGIRERTGSMVLVQWMWIPLSMVILVRSHLTIWLMTLRIQHSYFTEIIFCRISRSRSATVLCLQDGIWMNSVRNRLTIWQRHSRRIRLFMRHGKMRMRVFRMSIPK